MPVSPPSFASTWGCQMIAYIINAVLYGAGMLLSAQYLVRSRTDTKLTRLTVVTLTFLATLQMVALSHQIYEDFVVRFGNKEALDEIIFSAPMQLLIIYISAFIAQSFWTTRVWIITKNNVWLTAPVALLSLTAISAGIAQTIFLYHVGRFSLLRTTTILTARSVQSATTAACDVFITALLCYTLHDSRSTNNETNSVIDKMIIYAIERGAATSICALLNLIFFISIPRTFVFMIPLIPTSQLYLISIISMLMNRKSLSSRLNGKVQMSGSNSLTLSDIGSGHPHSHINKSPHTWDQPIAYVDIGPSSV